MPQALPLERWSDGKALRCLVRNMDKEWNTSMEPDVEASREELVAKEKQIQRLTEFESLKSQFLLAAEQARIDADKRNLRAVGLILVGSGLFFYTTIWPGVRREFSQGLPDGIFHLVAVLFGMLLMVSIFGALCGVAHSVYTRVGYLLNEKMSSLDSMRDSLIVSWILMLIIGYWLGHYGLLDGLNVGDKPIHPLG